MRAGGAAPVLSAREHEALVYCNTQGDRLWNQEELSLNYYYNVYICVPLGKLLISLNLKSFQKEDSNHYMLHYL